VRKAVYMLGVVPTALAMVPSADCRIAACTNSTTGSGPDMHQGLELT